MRHLLILVALAVENAGAAANHKLLRGLIGETEPRSEIVMIAIHDRAAVSVLAGQRVLAILNVEQTAEIARIHRLGEQLIAQAQVHGKFCRQLPIVLYEAAEVNAALASPIQHGCSLREARIAQQKIGERQS